MIATKVRLVLLQVHQVAARLPQVLALRRAQVVAHPALQARAVAQALHQVLARQVPVRPLVLQVVVLLLAVALAPAVRARQVPVRPLVRLRRVVLQVLAVLALRRVQALVPQVARQVPVRPLVLQVVVLLLAVALAPAVRAPAPPVVLALQARQAPVVLQAVLLPQVPAVVVRRVLLRAHRQVVLVLLHQVVVARQAVVLAHPALAHRRVQALQALLVGVDVLKMNHIMKSLKSVVLSWNQVHALYLLKPKKVYVQA